MNSILYQALTASSVAFLSTMFVLPLLSRMSHRWRLIDHPDARKLHQQAVPLVGGMAIFFALTLAIVVTPVAAEFVYQHWVSALATLSMFTMALMDDRFDLPAVGRLVLQVAAAFAVAHAGVRLESLHGFFGFEALTLPMQYVFTVLLIVGATNAFNLMDGLDGLLGNLSFLNFSCLSMIAFSTGHFGAAIITASIAVSLLAFLRKNSFPALIYMGDGGSMTLGFLNAVFAILLLKVSGGEAPPIPKVALVFSTMFLPALDAVRVFLHRFANGHSIFKADRTHLHHLVLQLGWNHGKIANAIAGYHLSMMVAMVVLSHLYNFTATALFIAAVQLAVSKLLSIHSKLAGWQQRISLSENNGASA